MEWTVLSVGGSIIVPDEIDVKMLKSLRALLLPMLKRRKFALVIGGGKTARKYMNAAKEANPKISKDLRDGIGIKATHINEMLLYAVFEKEADRHLLTSRPKQIRTNKRLILGAGWDVGASTDYNAVQLAKILKARTVINLTNVDYVYDKNPKKFRDAKPQPNLTWTQFKRIIGGKWTPGANVPFDPIASRLAERLGLTVMVLDGRKLDNVRKCLQGKSFKGTVISR
ncbi:MAG TPA: UMP kinase [Candidatus Nanoarchaeia archaeon]|nr:UMP kinase [Candidatus Nanoarchaeia archaeon]